MRSLLLKVVMFYGLYAQQTPQKLPVVMNFNSSITNYFQPKNISDANSTFNCLIVPCNVVDFQQNCLVVTKLTYGGDCYSNYFVNSINYTDKQDVITVEFAGLIVHQPQSNKTNSGLTFGYENGYEFTWALAEDQSLITSGLANQSNGTAQFVQLNGYPQNTWMTIRFYIRPRELTIAPYNSTYQPPFRLVLEDYIAAADLPGQFLITNLTVFHQGSCSPDCVTCNSYVECTACNTTRLYQGVCITDLCYYDLNNIVASIFTVGWISQTSQLYGIQIQGIQISSCYSVVFTMGSNNNYLNSSNPSINQYQYGYYINNDTMTLCKQYTILPTSKQPGYLCTFNFQLSLKQSASSLVTQQWTQEFYFNLTGTNGSVISASNSITNVSYQGLTTYVDTIKLATTITVNSTVGICTSSDCKKLATNPQLYLGQTFYIVAILAPDSEDFGLNFKFALTSATAIGNGTAVPLNLISTYPKNMTAQIFSFIVPMVVYNCTIQFSASLVTRTDAEIAALQAQYNSQTSSGLRILADGFKRLLATSDTSTTQSSSTDSSSTSGYGVAKQIKITEILPGLPISGIENAPFIIFGVVGFCFIILFIYLCQYFKLQKSITATQEGQQIVLSPQGIEIIKNEPDQQAIYAKFNQI